MYFDALMDPGTLAGVGKSSLVLKEAAIAFIPITLISLSLRMYVRIFIVRGFGLDDIMLLTAQAFFLVFCAIGIKLINTEHDPEMVRKFLGGPADAVSALEIIYTDAVLFTMFYCFSIVFLKISLAVFYLRIVIKRWQRILIYVTTIVMTVYGFTYGFTYTFRCGTDTTHQLVARAQGKCLSDQTLLAMMYAFGALDAATDFIFATLPIVILWVANMPRAMKFTAGILLCMGSVSSICALIRVATLSNLVLDIQFFKQAVQTGLWSIIEPGLGIVATSLAACRPLWRKVFESGSTGSLIKNSLIFKWSSRKTGMSSASRSGKQASRPSGLTFVERSEGNKGFKKFNDAEYGISTTTVMAGEERESNELQDLGRLEAQSDYAQEDRSEKSLVRNSLGPENAQNRNNITKTRDVRVNVSEGSSYS